MDYGGEPIFKSIIQFSIIALTPQGILRGYVDPHRSFEKKVARERRKLEQEGGI
jgi:hypothetical protein